MIRTWVYHVFYLGPKASPNGSKGGESYLVFGKSAETGLPADINGDGIVVTADLGILIGSFGMMSP